RGPSRALGPFVSFSQCLRYVRLAGELGSDSPDAILAKPRLTSARDRAAVLLACSGSRQGDGCTLSAARGCKFLNQPRLSIDLGCAFRVSCPPGGVGSAPLSTSDGWIRLRNQPISRSWRVSP